MRIESNLRYVSYSDWKVQLQVEESLKLPLSAEGEPALSQMTFVSRESHVDLSCIQDLWSKMTHNNGREQHSCKWL